MRLRPTLLRVLICLAGVTGILLLYVPSSLPSNDVLRTIILVARALLLVLTPGGLALTMLPAMYDLDEKVALAPVLSLGMFPIMLLLCSAAHIALSAGTVRLLLSLLIMSLSLIWFRRVQLLELRFSRDLVAPAALVVVSFVALGVRLYEIRGIGYPAGGDSLHHTMITQLIMSGGRIPRSYEPLAPIPSFTYHFGFHAYSAFLGWLGGLEPHRAVLWGGQFLSALTVPSVWFLVGRLSHNKRAALSAAVMAGLVCMMPAHYVNWGRYAQLMGQVLLLPALGLLWDALDGARSSRWFAALAIVMAVAVGLSHYRVAIFYLVGAILVVVVRIYMAPRSVRRCVVFTAVAVVVLSAVLMLPWFPSVLDKTISSAQEVVARGDVAQYDYLTLDFVKGMGLRPAVLLAALLASVWLLLRRRFRPVAGGTLIWVIGVWFLANPSLSGIPSGFLTNGTLVLALYLPASILIGLALADVSQIPGERYGVRRIGLVSLLLVISVWGISGIGDKLEWGVDHGMFWVTDDDVAAMDWIAKNTPDDAGVSIAMASWQGDHIQGVDAGWWTGYITGRMIIVPPLVYINEMDSASMAQVDAQGWPMMNATTASEYAQAMRVAGLSYVYERSDHPVMQDADLADSSLFYPVYKSDAVAIYALSN